MEVLAKIAEEVGKRIRYANGIDPMVVAHTVCEFCNDVAATMVVKGETDSFGFVPHSICESCYSTTELEIEQHLSASDIADSTCDIGKVYVIDETTNIDTYRSWDLVTTSLRTATKMLRRASNIADKYAGLYPNKGIMEMSYNECVSKGYNIPKYIHEVNAVVKEVAPLSTEAPHDTIEDVESRVRAESKGQLNSKEYYEWCMDLLNSGNVTAALQKQWDAGTHRSWCADLWPSLQDGKY